MENDTNQMTADEMCQKVDDFIANATPKKLSLLVDEFDTYPGGGDFRDFINIVKAIAFVKMLKVIGAGRHTYSCNNSKRYSTFLNIEHSSVFLVVSKKDSKNLTAMYIRLYDQHKDELLQIIEARNAATPEKDGVLK